MKTEEGIRSSHVGINVSDLDRSIGFYESLLGFQLVSRIVLEDGLRIGFLELPEQFQIELVETASMSCVEMEHGTMCVCEWRILTSAARGCRRKALSLRRRSCLGRNSGNTA